MYIIYVSYICIYIYNFSVWLQKENSYKNIFVLTFTYVTAILHYLLVFCSLSGISSFNPRRLSISKLFLKFLLHLFIYSGEVCMEVGGQLAGVSSFPYTWRSNSDHTAWWRASLPSLSSWQLQNCFLLTSSTSGLSLILWRVCQSLLNF